MIDWHRLFGIALIDFFAHSPLIVELEKDLSLKRQMLDVVIVRKEAGEFAGQLPDGLDNLATHNLLSYKSLREAVDDWTLDELIGHYVNYRKQVSPSMDNLLPTTDFQLYAISTRFPQKLASQVELKPLQPGVYEVVWGTHQIRLLVLNQMPQEAQNVLWNLFSAVEEKVLYAAEHVEGRFENVSSIINDLFRGYNLEGIAMPYTMQDYQREVAKRYLDQLTPEERLEGLAPDELLKGLSPDDRLKGLSPNDRLKGLSPNDRLKGLSSDDRLKGLSSDDRLKGLSPEEIRTYLEKLTKQKNV